MKIRKKQMNKGITLIALVITTIVLLILAGVTITTLTGENGILTRASEAKEDTVIAQEKEQVEIAYSSARINQSGENITSKELQDELDKVAGYNNTSVTGNNKFKVKFKDTEHIYTVGTSGEVSEYEKAEITGCYVAVYTDGTLVYSNNYEDIDESKIAEDGYYGNIDGNSYVENGPWAEDFYGKITRAVILNDIVPSSTTAGWFGFLEHVDKIEGLEKLNTENVTDMSYMFWDDQGLTQLDVSTFDTSKVTNMNQMFSEVCSLTNLDLSNFDTSNVTDMEMMFCFDENLTELDLSNFVVSNTTNVEDMFAGVNCRIIINNDMWTDEMKNSSGYEEQE